jgi:hypothetical protein
MSEPTDTPTRPALTEEQLQSRERWARVHIEADRRPLLPDLFPRLGRYMGEGARRSRGGFPRG